MSHINVSNQNSKSKAIFLDRDGVINDDHGYTYQPEDFDFLPGVFKACRRFMALDYKLVVVTNQSGIARGYYTEEDFETITDHMLSVFKQEGVNIDAVYHCPHHAMEGFGDYKIECDCRKPKPGMLLIAAGELNLDLSASVMIGDKLSDMQAGRAAGVAKCILISPNKTLLEDSRVDDIAESLEGVKI